MNRRTFLLAIAATALTDMTSAFAQRTATPEIVAPSERVTTFAGESITKDIDLDHYRVVDGGADLPGVFSVIGALVNHGSHAVDVPALIDVVAHDAKDVIVGNAFMQTDYPILPPETPIGFTALFPSRPVIDIDPSRMRFDVDTSLLDTGQVARLDANPLEILRAENVSVGDGNLTVECEVANTSDQDFENGINPRVSVWDSNGLYSGNAFANVFTRIPAGETVRFTTQTNGSIPNPLDIAGDDYTWEAWIDPR